MKLKITRSLEKGVSAPNAALECSWQSTRTDTLAVSAVTQSLRKSKERARGVAWITSGPPEWPHSRFYAYEVLKTAPAPGSNPGGPITTRAIAYILFRYASFPMHWKTYKYTLRLIHSYAKAIKISISI